MARTTGRSGFKLRSGNSVPFKELGAKPMAPPKPSKPGSSKEELLEIAEGFVTPVENIDLSGENFDIPTVDSSLVGGSKPGDPPPPGEDEPVTRTPAEIKGIKQDEITVAGANQQSQYQSGGGFGGSSAPTMPE